MPSLTSQLIIALRDNVSGPAKNAAASLKRVDAAAKTAGAGGAKGVQNLAASLDKVAAAKKKLDAPFKGLDLAREFGDLKLTRRELQLITKDFEALRGAMRGMKASDALGTFNLWKSRTVADLRDMRREMQATERARDRMFRGWRGGARFAAGAVGFGGVAYGVGRGVRGGARAAAGNEREGARDYLAGLTSAESARIKGRSLSLSGQYPSVDAQTMHESLRDAAMSMRSVEKAFEIGDVMARGLVVLQSLKEKDQAIEESRKFFKALDTMGKNINPDEVKALYDGYVKAIGVEGADMNMGDLLLAMRRSKSAGPGLSNRFLMTSAPGLMQDMGADRFGTALGSTVAQVIGDRATKEAKARQTAYGLRKGGKFIDASKLQQDPDLYAWENLIPALQKKKINPDDVTGVTKAMNEIFSNQLVSDIFTKLITQREQYQGKAVQFEKAPGIAGAQALPGKDPWVALEGSMAQLRNHASVLAEGALPRVIDLLNSFNSVLASINETLANNPKLKEQAGTAAGVAGGVAGAGATYLLARKAIRFLSSPFSGGGAGAGGAVTAQGSLTALTRIPGVAAAAGAVAAPWVLYDATKEDHGLTAGERLNKHRGGSMRDTYRRRFNQERERLGLPLLIESGVGTVGRNRHGGGIWSTGAEPLSDTTANRGMRAAGQNQDAWTKGASPLNADQVTEAAAAGMRAGDTFKRSFLGSVTEIDPPMEWLDRSREATAAGQRMGDAFKSGFDAALQGVAPLLVQHMQRWSAMLGSFSASPSITPQFGPLPTAPKSGQMPATGLKTGAAEIIKQKQHAMFADYGMNTA